MNSREIIYLALKHDPKTFKRYWQIDLILRKAIMAVSPSFDRQFLGDWWGV